MPDPDSFPAPSPPQPPFIFSEDQIQSLLQAAGELSATTLSPLQPQVYRLTVTLAYTAGLRRRELVLLTFGCFDPALRTLSIEESKFHKPRLIALSDEAAREMQQYLAARRQLPHHVEAPLLANRQGGCQAYSGDCLADGFQRLCRADGFRDAAGRAPRLHDLRHHPRRACTAALVSRRQRPAGQPPDASRRHGPCLGRFNGLLPAVP